MLVVLHLFPPVVGLVVCCCFCLFVLGISRSVWLLGLLRFGSWDSVAFCCLCGVFGLCLLFCFLFTSRCLCGGCRVVVAVRGFCF